MPIVNQASQSCHSLDDWLVFIQSQHQKTIDLGLARIQSVGERLGVCDLPGRVILIGGTNGKGTTASLLEAALLAQGFSTGVFSSPHIVKFNECVRINGQMADDAPFIAAFEAIEQARKQAPLTPFEYTTLAALWQFKQLAVDFAIVEVGMGGRGDSTNMVTPDISIITTVSIDHQAFLGRDREAIGYEKAGIMRAAKPVVIGEFNVPQSVIQYARDIGATCYQINQDFHVQQNGQSFDWRSETAELSALPLPNMPLQNVATAVKALELLGALPSDERLASILKEITVEGRFQCIGEQPKTIIDVAHNVESARYLAGRLKQMKSQGYRQVYAVAGMLKDKDIDGTLAQLAEVVDCWFLASLPGERGAEASILQGALEKQSLGPYSCYDNALDALSAAKQQSCDDTLIIIFGSFVTIAAVMQGE